MTLFGRTSEIEALRACAAVCVIAGDAGAGKSALLREVQLLTDGAAPAPVQLAERPGSLQQGVLEAMAAALADLNIAEGPLARVQRLAEATAQRLVDGRLQALARASGRIMRSYAVAHLGQDTVNAVGEIAGALQESQGQELERRITSSGEADVMAVIAALVRELADIAGSTPVVLALDDLHQLPDEDLRRFRDLMSDIDGAVMLRATFTVTTAADQAALDQIAAKGAQVVELSGLGPDAVDDWVVSSGVDPARATEIAAMTGGLPLYVGDAIALIGFGLPLDGLSGNKVLRARTRAAWSSLSDADQEHAVLLACLPAHPSPRRGAEILGVDELAWHNLIGRLVASGVLLRETEWFHQLRRACIHDLLLTSAQRETAEAKIVEQALALLREAEHDDEDVLEAVRTLGALVSAAVLAIGEVDDVERVANCTNDELRVLGGIVEIHEPSSDSDAVAITVLDRYLRETTPPDDLALAITSLDGELIASIAGPGGMSMIPTFGSREAWWLFLGRSANALGRFPVPSVATSLFTSVLRPLVEPFHQAQYGVGDPSLADLADSARKLRATPRDGVITHSPRWPSLAFRGKVGALPIYGVIAYNVPTDRDRHQDELTDFSSNVLDSEFSITNAWAIPTDRLPLARFSSVFGALVSRSNPAPVPRAVGDAARLHKATHDFLRRHTSDLEQDVLDMREPIGVLHDSDDGSWMFAEVLGGDDLGPADDPTALLPQDAGGWLTRSDRLGLVGGQRIGRVRGGTGAVPTDPIGDEIGRRTALAGAFNRANLRVNVRYELDHLRPVLEEAHRQRRALVDLMCIELLERPVPPPTTTYVVIDIGKPEGNWVPGVQDNLVVVEVPSVDDHDHLHVAQGKAIMTIPFDAPLALEPHFAEVGEDVSMATWQFTDAARWIASYLGYDFNDIWLTYRDTIPPPGADVPVEWDLAD